MSSNTEVARLAAGPMAAVPPLLSPSLKGLRW